MKPVLKSLLVFIRDCFEDELVPVFASVGKIYELRLMIEFSGTNRTYCYVRYLATSYTGL